MVSPFAPTMRSYPEDEAAWRWTRSFGVARGIRTKTKSSSHDRILLSTPLPLESSFHLNPRSSLITGKNPIEKALEKAKGLKEFIQQPRPLSNEERKVAKGDLKLISGWLKSALTTSPENAKHLKDASDMASELLQTIKNYSHFPSFLTERDRTLVPILQKQIQSKLDLVLKNMARLPPAFAAVKK